MSITWYNKWAASLPRRCTFYYYFKFHVHCDNKRVLQDKEIVLIAGSLWSPVLLSLTCCVCFIIWTLEATFPNVSLLVWPLLKTPSWLLFKNSICVLGLSSYCIWVCLSPRYESSSGTSRCRSAERWSRDGSVSWRSWERSSGSSGSNSRGRN